ncbi:hypothetical protein EVAR_91561_1 [Eumeta japonica]|uniref:Uncharacterized protein n=1 Tax=Eumeta variegata TaxID=151549 RepID=A0A4C1XB32_EUMVA|nr:hypothetical protein EVAR_91561_1 [Eumeta japonica]
MDKGSDVVASGCKLSSQLVDDSRTKHHILLNHNIDIYSNFPQTLLWPRKDNNITEEFFWDVIFLVRAGALTKNPSPSSSPAALSCLGENGGTFPCRGNKSCRLGRDDKARYMSGLGPRGGETLTKKTA